MCGVAWCRSLMTSPSSLARRPSSMPWWRKCSLSWGGWACGSSGVSAVRYVWGGGRGHTLLSRPHAGPSRGGAEAALSGRWGDVQGPHHPMAGQDCGSGLGCSGIATGTGLGFCPAGSGTRAVGEGSTGSAVRGRDLGSGGGRWRLTPWGFTLRVRCVDACPTGAEGACWPLATCFQRAPLPPVPHADPDLAAPPTPIPPLGPSFGCCSGCHPVCCVPLQTVSLPGLAGPGGACGGLAATEACADGELVC